MIFGDVAEVDAYEQLVQAFETRYPEINVQLSPVPSQNDYYQRLATLFSAGSPPDITLLNYRRMALFANEGALEPLNTYMDESNILQSSDFYPQAMDAFILDDTLWCVPQNISSLVVYYNQDLFDAVGLPYPTVGWTLDDFIDTAQRLTLDLDGDGQVDQYGAGIDPSLVRLAPFIWQAGGELVDDPNNPTHLDLDSTEALAAFQWFVDLQIKEKVVPDQAAEVAESSENRFLNGRLAMFFNSRRGVPNYRTTAIFRWDVVPLPKGNQEAGILHSDGYCMAAKTENKEAAWKFIEYANSREGQIMIAATGRTVPSMPVVAESNAFLNPDIKPGNSQVFIDTISTLHRMPTVTNWPAIEEITNREIERAFYGQVSVETAALTAISSTLALFDSSNP